MRSRGVPKRGNTALPLINLSTFHAPRSSLQSDYLWCARREANPVRPPAGLPSGMRRSLTSVPARPAHERRIRTRSDCLTEQITSPRQKNLSKKNIFQKDSRTKIHASLMVVVTGGLVV